MRRSSIESALTAQVISNFSDLSQIELASIAAGWDSLAKHQKSPLLTFDWFQEAASAFSDPHSLYVVVVRRQGDICAIAPMVKRIVAQHQHLVIVGSMELYEPSGLLYSDATSLAFLLAELRKPGVPVDCSRIDSNSELLHGTSHVMPGKTFCLKIPTAPSYFLNLDKDWEDFENSLSRSRRYGIRRKLNRAARRGDYHVIVHSPDNLQQDDSLASAMRVEDSGWKHQAGSSMLQSPSLKQFFNRYCDRAAKRGILRIFFITVGGQYAAALIAVECHEALWVLKLGYREEFADLSPGILVTHESIRYAIENGLKRYEFLGSSEAWQASWPAEQRNYSTFLAIPWNSAGILWILSAIKARILNRLVRENRTRNE